MSRLTIKNVFEALSERLLAHEETTEKRFNDAETAIEKFREEFQRRIDQLDERIDERAKNSSSRCNGL